MPYLTANIMGGLGNQLFQILFVLQKAKTYNMDAVFPNKYQLDSKRHTYYHLFPTIKLSESIHVDRHVRERGFEFKNYGCDPNVSTMFNGYFQSALYFPDIDPHDIFKLPDDDLAVVNERSNEWRQTGKTLVSVHVRHGDYLTPTTKAFHGILDVNYYRRAVDKLKDLGVIIMENTLFVIFSDDIEWCKENFGFLSNIYYVNEKDYIEMVLMSKCDHHIVANSSFSWWGAYLNKSKDKEVIGPTRWFLAPLNTKDLCPISWHRI
jgi:hypothetical protein